MLTRITYANSVQDEITNDKYVFCWGLPEKLGAYGAGNPCVGMDK